MKFQAGQSVKIVCDYYRGGMTGVVERILTDRSNRSAPYLVRVTEPCDEKLRTAVLAARNLIAIQASA